MKWIYFFFLLSFLANTSCSQRPPISGTIAFSADSHHWNPTVYLIQPRTLKELATSYSGVVIDSAIIAKDGSFAFKELPEFTHPVLLELAIQPKGVSFPNRLENENIDLSNYFPIVWRSGDHLEILASADQFQHTFSFRNPTPENAALLSLRDIRQKGYQKLQFRPIREAHEEADLLEDEKAILDFQQPIMDFARQTEHLLPAMVAIRWVSPNNDYERVPEFLYDQCKKWETAYSDHPWVVELCEKGDPKKLPVLKGGVIPDALLPLLSGDSTSLYSLLGNRITVLDLWASWCAPCRVENREVLLPLWEKYHDNGFQIVGYALDAGDKAWKNAIEKDGAAVWVHASHLQGDDAPLMATLRIQTIPANFILDGQGKVLAKNLHGENLVKFIEKYLQQ